MLRAVMLVREVKRHDYPPPTWAATKRAQTAPAAATPSEGFHTSREHRSSSSPIRAYRCEL